MIDEKDQKEIARFVIGNLPQHKHFALGTIDQDGKPWVVCANLTFDNYLNIIWKSKKDTEHSKHIKEDPNVSICVFSQIEGVGDFGLYAKAVAHEVTDEMELDKCLDFRFRRRGKKVPPKTEFLGNAEYRLYLAEINEAWVTDDQHLKIKVDLNILRENILVFSRILECS